MVQKQIKEIIKQLIKDFYVTIGIEDSNGEKTEAFVGITKIWNYILDWDEFFNSFNDIGYPFYTIEPVKIVDDDRIIDLDLDKFKSYFYLTVDYLLESNVQQAFMAELAFHTPIIPPLEIDGYYDWTHSVGNVIESIVMNGTPVETAIKNELDNMKDEDGIEMLSSLLNTYADRVADYIKNIKLSIIETDSSDIELRVNKTIYL